MNPGTLKPRVATKMDWRQLLSRRGLEFFEGSSEFRSSSELIGYFQSGKMDSTGCWIHQQKGCFPAKADLLVALPLLVLMAHLAWWGEALQSRLVG